MTIIDSVLYYLISNPNRQAKINKILYSKNWMSNIPIIAEAIILLDIVKIINKKIKYILYGSIIVFADKLKLACRINNPIYKPNLLSQDTGAEITRIKTVLKNIKYEVIIELIKDYPKAIRLFIQSLFEHLIVECDRNAKNTRENIDKRVKLVIKY